MSFYSINGKSLDEKYFNARPSGSYGTDTTGLTNYRINGVDLINYYYKPGDNSGDTNTGRYNSNLKYTSTTPFTFSSGSTSIDISNLFQLNLFNSSTTTVTYDTIAIDSGIIIKITSAPPPPVPITTIYSVMEFNFPIDVADILIVGGGGGGGATNENAAGGGGGAGQLGLINWDGYIDRPLFTRLINIKIGEGGAGGVNDSTERDGAAGSDSSLRLINPIDNYTIVCKGGGGGGMGNTASPNTPGGSSGGSGASMEANTQRVVGSGKNDQSTGTLNTFKYVDYLAKEGGEGAKPTFNLNNNVLVAVSGAGGGGGGANTNGNFDGGDGYKWNDIIVGGGGGGGGGITVIGEGGLGGGGRGGGNENARPGIPNTGGGGGGAPSKRYDGSSNGAAGGSGVIYIKIRQGYLNF
jgi:hypothetical protein